MYEHSTEAVEIEIDPELDIGLSQRRGELYFRVGLSNDARERGVLVSWLRSLADIVENYESDEAPQGP